MTHWISPIESEKHDFNTRLASENGDFITRLIGGVSSAVTFSRRLLYAQFRLSLHSKSQGFHSSVIRMEASNQTTVPSIVVYVTVPNKEAGKKLAASIVKEKLAACVNRVPGIESVYLWDGEILTDSEELLIIKTRESLLNALTEHVKENHEYDVPEVIALPITGGSIPYLEWLKNSTREE
ncbi:hypothetical protein R6Q59_035521 [Mikania micrantha]